MKRSFVLSCLLMLSGCGGQSQNSPLDETPPSVSEPGRCALTAVEHAMLDAVNAARASARSCGGQQYAAAPALKWSCLLAAAAGRHAQDMAAHDFLDHTGSDGLQLRDRVRAAGYAWSTIGENVAAGQRSVEAVMQSWLQSQGHCANMMNPAFQDMGAALAENNDTTYVFYWTQVFGRER